MNKNTREAYTFFDGTLYDMEFSSEDALREYVEECYLDDCSAGYTSKVIERYLGSINWTMFFRLYVSNRRG